MGLLARGTVGEAIDTIHIERYQISPEWFKMKRYFRDSNID